MCAFDNLRQFGEFYFLSMNRSYKIKMVLGSLIYVLPHPVFEQVDGMDILCVREATRFAAAYCRSGKVRLSLRSVG